VATKFHMAVSRKMATVKITDFYDVIPCSLVTTPCPIPQDSSFWGFHIRQIFIVPGLLRRTYQLLTKHICLMSWQADIDYNH